MKILLLDIETSPNTAYVWTIWQENIPLARLIDSSSILCWSAKWHGEDEMYFDSIHQSKKKTMLKRIHKLLDEADAVVTFNGNKFDLPVLNKEFLLQGFGPPAPYKSVDLYQTVKRKFRFVSNKLDYISEQLGLGKKHQTEFSLWVRCMNKDADAWEEMELYNKHDVTLLEGNYNILLPWITTHPNHSTHTGTLVCPRCGGSHYQRRGDYLTTGGVYQRFNCRDCGKWFRSNKSHAAKERFLDI